jgi:rod shape-determining protein MreC
MLSDRNARRRLVVFVMLVGLCLVMLVVSGSAPVQELRRGVNFAFAPIQERLSEGTRSVTDVFAAVEEVGTLKRQNDELRSTVAQLKGELATLDAIRSENKELNKLLKTKKDLEHATVAAGVSAYSSTQFERIISLDRGSEAGIREGAPVVSLGGFLAGRVTEVGDGWAEVMLITDTRFPVAGKDNRTGATGLITGRLSAPLAMADIQATDKIEVNDLIVTLGAVIGKRFRSVYPKNLPIGRVIDVQEESGSTLKVALVQPEADLDHLEHVLVLTDFKPPKRKGDDPDEASEGA